jgi:hypothetical protein
MKQSIFNVLINPDTFFAQAMGENENLTLPALIVLAGSIVAAAYGYLVGGLTAKMMASATPGVETIITISTILGAILGTFIFWIVWAGVFSAFSYAFKGQGSFRRMMEFVGYGYLPQILGSVISLVAAIEYIPRIAVPKISAAALQDTVVMEHTMKALMHDPAMMELTQITTLVTIVFLLWSANIWIFGAKHARQLSPRNSALCVGIPVVAYVLYMIYNLGVM